MRALSTFPFLTLALLLISAQGNPARADCLNECNETFAEQQARISAANAQENQKSMGNIPWEEKSNYPQSSNTEKKATSSGSPGYFNSDGYYVCQGTEDACRADQDRIKAECSEGDSQQRQQCRIDKTNQRVKEIADRRGKSFGLNDSVYKAANDMSDKNKQKNEKAIEKMTTSLKDQNNAQHKVAKEAIRLDEQNANLNYKAAKLVTPGPLQKPLKKLFGWGKKSKKKVDTKINDTVTKGNQWLIEKNEDSANSLNKAEYNTIRNTTAGQYKANDPRVLTKKDNNTPHEDQPKTSGSSQQAEPAFEKDPFPNGSDGPGGTGM